MDSSIIRQEMQRSGRRPSWTGPYYQDEGLRTMTFNAVQFPLMLYTVRRSLRKLEARCKELCINSEILMLTDDDYVSALQTATTLLIKLSHEEDKLTADSGEGIKLEPDIVASYVAFLVQATKLFPKMEKIAELLCSDIEIYYAEIEDMEDDDLETEENFQRQKDEDYESFTHELEGLVSMSDTYRAYYDQAKYFYSRVSESSHQP